MADPRSKFYKALAKFKYKSLYANVVNDKRCSWYTASISPDDKVNSLYNKRPENINCKYIKDTNQMSLMSPNHFIMKS